MKLQLANYLNRYVAFETEEIDLIFDALSTETFQKKEFLLEQYQVCKHRYFIIEGLIRSFRTDSNGNENISLFGIENWWITNLDSFINETPSQNAIQAVEKTTVLSISKNDLEVLYTKVPKLERAFRIITEKTLIAIQRKDEIYMKQHSKERYYNLVDTIPNFAQRVPQYMIASYLDITPEYLSEIRKNR
ncbi:Crp/Fnr family transcriptional regulator [uncultured Kordia sp.]|uniref:Crp/Fnr family transcriptional regulator n=1 Tax=uncultured Kordia sp. TaxID=507699 RepID=UPI00260DEA72|nr:cyclic nucleotide-binding domain-containing protein [uncultured Kordia sp.]